MALWRLTNNRHTRRAYGALKRRGVTATRLVEYTASLPLDAEPDAPVALETCSADAACERYGLDFDAPFTPRNGERAVVALADGEAVGRVLVSAVGDPYVSALEAEVPLEGAYLRKVFVAPDHREQGVATALVAEACAVADRIGATRASTLLATDDRLTQRVFEANGFEPRREHTYVRVGPWATRRTGETADV